MANIKKYLENILNARFGEEVRGSFHNAIYAMNDQVVNAENSTIKNAAASASSAAASANSAKASAQSEANAKRSENLAKQYMEQAMDTTPDGYNENMELLHAMDIQTSAENTLYGTKPGGLSLIGMGGGTEQKSYPGYQLFDASKLATKSAGGATVTNNGDGSFTISGSGTLSEKYSNAHYNDHAATVQMLKVGTLYLKNNGTTYPRPFIQLLRNNAVLITLEDGMSYDITQELLDDETFIANLYFNGESGSTITTGTVKPMLYQDGDGTWEPFVGGQPSPNPDYPQSINNTGDCVEMMQGGYSVNSGAYSYNTQYICNKHPIPCETGDVINLAFEVSQPKVRILFYNENGYVSFLEKTDTANVSFVVPSDCASFYFTLYGENGITPSTVGKIQLTVNDKYVTQIVERGKNLCALRSVQNSTFDETNGLLTSITTSNIYNSYGKIIARNGSVYVDEFHKNIPTGTHAKEFIKDESFNVLVVGFNGDTVDAVCTFDVSNLVNGTTYYVNMNIGELKPNGNTISNIMITTNPEYDDTYEPYREHIATIYTDEPIRSGDVVFKDDDRLWKVERNRAKGVLDDSIGFLKNSLEDDTNYLYYTKGFTNALRSAEILSNKLATKGLNVMNGGNSIDTIGINNSVLDGIIYINVGHYLEENTVDAVRTWCGENPIEFEYPTITPTYEILDTASQLALNSLKTFNGVTRIEIDSRVQSESVEWEYGTSQVGAYALQALNENDTDKIERAAMKAQLEELATAMLVLSQA